MERWELKAGVTAILGNANRSLTSQDLARGLAGQRRSVGRGIVAEYEANLKAADQGMQVRHRAGYIRIEARRSGPAPSSSQTRSGRPSPSRIGPSRRSRS
jgi:hypothetical protein